MNPFKSIAKIALATLIYAVVQALTGGLLPMNPAFSAIPEAEKWMTLPALLVVGAVYSVILFLYCRRSSLRTPRLLLLAALVMFAVGTFQTQIETWYFRKAFAVLTDRDLALLFAHGLILSLVFSSLAVLVFRGGAKKGIDYPEARRDYSFDRRWWKYLLAALVYLPLYFGFGLLAKLAPVLGTTYAGWIADEGLVAFLPVFQIFRGALFMLLSVLVVSLFPKRSDALLALTLTLSLFISVELAFPSVLMPSALRLVHFFEITLSMLVYSFVLVALVSRPKAPGAAGANMQESLPGSEPRR